MLVIITHQTCATISYPIYHMIKPNESMFTDLISIWDNLAAFFFIVWFPIDFQNSSSFFVSIWTVLQLSCNRLKQWNSIKWIFSFITFEKLFTKYNRNPVDCIQYTLTVSRISSIPYKHRKDISETTIELHKCSAKKKIRPWLRTINVINLISYLRVQNQVLLQSLWYALAWSGSPMHKYFTTVVSV